MNKCLFYLMALVVFQPAKARCQSTQKDTVSKNEYKTYINESRAILDNIKQNQGLVLKAYFNQNFGLFGKKELEVNLKWVQKILRNNHKLPLASPILILTKYRDTAFAADNSTSLSIVYDIGKSECPDAMFGNKITIIFSNIEKNEKYFDFLFDNCAEDEKIKRAILDLPPPKNN